MLTYSFANIGSDSLYEYLYKCMKNDIEQGVLVPHTKLPSKRSFAKNLGISTITVENAYGQLMSEGYIYSIPKKGYYVTDFQKVQRKSATQKPPGQVPPVQATDRYLADFTSNQMDPHLFPFSVWAKISRELLSNCQKELLVPPPCGGILVLREAIAKHLKEFRGMNVEPQQIIVGAGTEYLYGLLLQLLGFEKCYAIEDPGYDKISKIYQCHKAACIPIPMDQAGVSIEALEEQGIDVVHISPSHHFPTGIIMPISRRYELLGWAAKSDSRYIIEDEYDSEFRMSGRPIPSLQSIAVQEKVIYMNTFTKTLSSTIRISYMVLPKHLVNLYYNKLSFYSCTVSNFEQYTLAHFLSEGYFEKHINRMRNYYHKKRDLLLETIAKSPLSSYVTISEEDAGLHFLLTIRTKQEDAVLQQKLYQAGIKLSYLSQYYHVPPNDCSHVFIINYSSVPEEVMEEAIQRIYESVRGTD